MVVVVVVGGALVGRSRGEAGGGSTGLLESFLTLVSFSGRERGEGAGSWEPGQLIK